MKNIWLIFCFSFTQLNAQIDFEGISIPDALKVDSKTTKTSEWTEENHCISLIAEDGEPFFSRIKSDSSDEEEIWLRQESDSSVVWNVYAIKKVEGRTKRDLFMKFHKTQLDGNTYREELIQEHRQISKEVQRIDTNTTFTLPDSIYAVKSKKAEGEVIKYYKLLPSGDTTLIGQIKISNSQMDHMNNWSEQTKTAQRFRSNNFEIEYDIQSNRKIYYRDSFKREQYYEIIPSSLIVNGQKMTYEDNKKAFEKRKKTEFEATGASIGYDLQYKIIDRYFYKRYFNSKYFFEVEIPDIIEKKILEKRLFTDISINILGLHNQEFYSGRLHYNRWFDKTRSFQQMKTYLSEKMESLTKTGKTKEVNGYKCDEYKMLIDSKERFYYVTEELPFIDYFMSNYTFPGFVLRIEEHFDQVGQVIFECDVKKVNYPAHYLEFTKKGQEKLGIKFNYLSQLYK